MLSHNNGISELEDIMIRNNLFEKFKLSKVGVFGSTARGEESNDIDILIAGYTNPIVLHRAKKEIIYVIKH